MFPRKAGSKWEIWTTAKLNLYLEVLGRQQSGYHEIETLMTPICLYDHLQWSPIAAAGDPTGLAFRLLYSGHRASDGLHAGGEILGENNLVLRAARQLACRAGIDPYGTLTLRKRIPISAGVGGGSSDAAATLALANRAWGINYPVSVLIELASELGSDVPFFLTPGMAICRGRGEQIEPVRSLGRLHFVVVKPSMGFSASEVFAQVAHNTIPDSRVQESQKRLAKLVEALRSGVISVGARWMTNRLEEVATSMSDWFGRIRKVMSECGCCGQWMTGSGSAYVGLVGNARQAYHVGGLLASRRLGTVFVTSSTY